MVIVRFVETMKGNIKLYSEIKQPLSEENQKIYFPAS